MLKNTDSDFSSLLPDSIRHDPVIQGLQAAFAGEYRRLVAAIPAVMPWERLDEQTEPVLSLMAYEVNPLLWEPGWTDTVKRDVLRGSLRWRMIHGTPACVEEFAAAVTGAGVETRPWYSYQGEPGRFRVHLEISDSPLTDGEMAQAYKAIRAAKNTRSHLDGVRITFVCKTTAHAGGVTLIDKIITLEPYTPGLAPATASGHPAGAVSVLKRITLTTRDQKGA